jgi:hypothetical protein
MLANRAFLLACATIATLGLAAVCSTPADAKPCKTADSTPREEKACLLRAAITAAVSEAAEQAARAKQAAMEKQAAAKQAAAAKQGAAKQAGTNAPAEKPTALTGNVCLTKEYLDNGAVMFRDTCTGEWAQGPSRAH